MMVCVVCINGGDMYMDSWVVCTMYIEVGRTPLHAFQDTTARVWDLEGEGRGVLDMDSWVVCIM